MRKLVVKIAVNGTKFEQKLYIGSAVTVSRYLFSITSYGILG